MSDNGAAGTLNSEAYGTIYEVDENFLGYPDPKERMIAVTFLTIILIVGSSYYWNTRDRRAYDFARRDATVEGYKAYWCDPANFCMFSQADMDLLPKLDEKPTVVTEIEMMRRWADNDDKGTGTMMRAWPGWFTGGVQLPHIVQKRSGCPSLSCNSGWNSHPYEDGDELYFCNSCTLFGRPKNFSGNQLSSKVKKAAQNRRCRACTEYGWKVRIIEDQG